MNWRRIILGATCFTLGCTVFHFAQNGVVVLNGSHSLPQNAFLMDSSITKPIRGAYASFDPPVSVEKFFTDLVFVKKIVGLEGDAVIATNDEVCVATRCFSIDPEKRAEGFLPLESGVIPDGFFFASGVSDDSLDSRYAIIGLIPVDTIKAIGVGTPFPHWTALKGWLS